ncbi:hypothetical protein K0P33_27505 [Pseudomonas sp. ArH3a]|uniref:hypothetical protein n=1 Tax=Pseudomonas sp. ArH3a TaxID=2862945 RepID=UPI001F5A243C|nr:hypothetical protein [Pseudomonas sp. ArH3a]UNM19210.1 hypothetical protein K0P33_27505 [Pseudomonas sp. ArH3a]
MTRIFQHHENVYKAADSVQRHGYAAIEGTLSTAVPYCKRVIHVLSVYKEVLARMSYLNVPKQGYLYFVYDGSKFTLEEVEPRILAVDLRSSL